MRIYSRLHENLFSSHQTTGPFPSEFFLIPSDCYSARIRICSCSKTTWLGGRLEAKAFVIAHKKIQGPYFHTNLVFSDYCKLFAGRGSDQYLHWIMPSFEPLMNFTMLLISSLGGICSSTFMMASCKLVSPWKIMR